MDRLTVEQAVKIGGFAAVAAQQPMLAEYPQVTRPRCRFVRRSGDLVRIGQSFLHAGIEQLGEFVLVEPAVTAPAPEIDLDFELTKGFAARYIRAKARRLVGHASLKTHDCEDIQQELTLAVWRAAPSFDPQAGDWKSFVSTIVERLAARYLIERRRMKRRLGHEVGSLDVTILDADGVEVSLASQIPSDQREQTTGRYALSDQEHAEAAHDVAVILAAAPRRTRELCEQLMHASEREVIEQQGTTRRTLREHLKRLRRKYAPEEFQKNQKRRVADSSANRKA